MLLFISKIEILLDFVVTDKKIIMKKLIITSVFILAGILSFAQTKNNISLYFGKANDIKTPVATGDWQNPQNSYSFELTYSRIVFKQIAIETGFRYSNHNITTGFDAEPWRPDIYSNLYLISIPIRVHVSLGKYFFCKAGFTFDKDFKRDKLYPMEDQTGLGFELGLGCKIDIKKFRLIISPMYSNHSLVAFNQDKNKTYLHELAIKFGIAYNF